MNLSKLIFLVIGILLSVIAIYGIIFTLNNSFDLTSLLTILIIPGFFFMYKGLFLDSSASVGVSYGGICKTCDEWCDVIQYEGQECCDCADELPLDDRCSTCYEKSQDRMS